MDKTSPTRRRRKEARPEEILAAALESFAARGFAATRIEDVAARAGISKGTLYLYFDGKEELFKAVVRQALLPNLARIEALAATFEGPSALLLERLLLTVAGVVELEGRRDPETGDRRGRQFSGPRALLPGRGGPSRPRADRGDP